MQHEPARAARAFSKPTTTTKLGSLLLLAKGDDGGGNQPSNTEKVRMFLQELARAFIGHCMQLLGLPWRWLLYLWARRRTACDGTKTVRTKTVREQSCNRPVCCCDSNDIRSAALSLSPLGTGAPAGMRAWWWWCFTVCRFCRLIQFTKGRLQDFWTRATATGPRWVAGQLSNLASGLVRPFVSSCSGLCLALSGQTCSYQRSIRAGFIRKVYGILTARVALTIAMAAGACWSSAFCHASLLGYYYQKTYLALSLVTMGVTMSFKDLYPINFGLLTLLTILLGGPLAGICGLFWRNGYAQQVLASAVLTAVSFGGLSIYAVYSDRDFSSWGAFLYSSLYASIALGLLGWMSPAAGVTMSRGYVGAFLNTLAICGFVVYDTDRIYRGRKFTVDDYIPAAIELYLDLLRLFLEILIRVAEAAKNKDKD